MANLPNSLGDKEKATHQSNSSLHSNYSRMTVNSQISALYNNSSSSKHNLFTKVGHRLQSMYKRFKGTHTQLTEMEIQVLITLTSFTREEVYEWHEKFLHDCPNGFMSRKQFVQMYKQLSPKGDAERFAKHVYRAFDLDKSGQVDFKEFIIGLSITSSNSTPKQKLQWIFNVFDIDGNGYLTRKECCEVVESIVRFNSNDENTEELAKQRMMKIFNESDGNKHDQLTLNDFIRGCEKDTLIYNLLLPSKTTTSTTTLNSSDV
ncbi:unnamed protein product [Didymodactylos carnosus]|uniref:EF-hand domain-containing protein n=1 Tax=Didymodactylos carnosus TaxID=1234261 RepID=A0A813PDX7_9BILA|nr:unnamed protein product [Didymodactylos carnosus]CAF0749744.1 unnamed protein product [Didymodactylos carnosus]CAF3519239.1 unnamed protein product [Didymodactylos carnosus]CAF3529078.1 unnamed protein product [Didymodactylos carnosus]